MNSFGTDGIRSRIGEGLLTASMIPLVGKAIGKWALQKYGNTVHILLSSDTRISGQFIRTSLIAGLSSIPVKVTDAGIIPTPALIQLISEDTSFDIGIMISASHNPYHDNGLKIVEKKLGKLSLIDELKISDLIKQYTVCEKIFYNIAANNYWPQALDKYIDIIISYFDANFLKNKTIILDTAHGSTYRAAPHIFRKLGANVHAINHKPNGININYKGGAVYPETLQRAVLAYQADIGFAFDGDGDRLIAINAEGTIKDGDDILAILSDFSAYKHLRSIVGTIMSNQGLENFLLEKEKTLIRTAVGDKYIAQKIQEANLLLGGEQSGHIILNDLASTGDGILAALRLCQALQEANNWSMKSFTKYPQILMNIPVQKKRSLDEPDLAELINESQKKLNNGRVLVRYSGTELCLRIMVEDKDKNHALKTAQSLAQKLQKELT